MRSNREILLRSDDLGPFLVGIALLAVAWLFWNGCDTRTHVAVVVAPQCSPSPQPTPEPSPSPGCFYPPGWHRK
jgi:hypothetical protein